ncbi:MAG: hypothetical protein QM831_44790 [Kofleriaceae bacterium]
MRFAFAAILLTGCLGDLADSEPDYYDDPTPWHVTLNVTSPMAFTELHVSFLNGEEFPRNLTYDPQVTTATLPFSFSEQVRSVDLDTDVGDVHLHGGANARYTDYDNPMADQTLHKFEADGVLEVE